MEYEVSKRGGSKQNIEREKNDKWCFEKYTTFVFRSNLSWEKKIFFFNFLNIVFFLTPFSENSHWKVDFLWTPFIEMKGIYIFRYK